MFSYAICCKFSVNIALSVWKIIKFLFDRVVKIAWEQMMKAELRSSVMLVLSFINGVVSGYNSLVTHSTKHFGQLMTIEAQYIHLWDLGMPYADFLGTYT